MILIEFGVKLVYHLAVVAVTCFVIGFEEGFAAQLDWILLSPIFLISFARSHLNIGYTLVHAKFYRVVLVCWSFVKVFQFNGFFDLFCV